MKAVIGISCGISDQAGREQETLNTAYVKAVEAAGAIPVILPNISETKDIPGIVARLDGILLSGGEDLDPAYYGVRPDGSLSRIWPRRDRAEMALALHLLQDSRMPFLAICRGMQLINAAAGGSLIMDLKQAGYPNHAFSGIYPREITVHEVSVHKDSLLHRITGRDTLAVNSFHHQAVDRLGEGFFESARSLPDGCPEAMEMSGKRFALAVQWHPEELIREEAHLALFAALAEAAKKSE